MSQDLRQKALDLLDGKYKLDEALREAELPDLLQELSIYQIELQLQNEELQKTQADVEKARQRYYDYYEFAPVGYVTLDKHGKIQSANLTARQLLAGKDDARLEGSPFLRYIVSEHHTRLHEHLDKAWQDQVAQHTQLCTRYKPAETHRSAFSDNPETTNESKFTGLMTSADTSAHPWLHIESVSRHKGQNPILLMTLTDISKQKYLELELREQKNILEATQHQAKLGYWWRDYNTGFGGWSPELYRILGYTEDEDKPTYENFLARVHPDERDYVHQTLQNSTEHGHAFDLEIALKMPYGQIRYIHARSIVINNEDDKNYMYGIAQDITEQRNMREKLLRRELENTRMDILTRFVRDASHEFRTPLTGLQSSLELTHRKADITFFQQRYPRLIGHINRIERIVETMTLSSRIYMTDKIEPRAIVPASLIEQARFSLRSESEASAIQWQITIAEDAQPIMGDIDFLTYALQEVLHNAIRFSTHQQTIHILVTPAEEYTLIAIQDRGIGIPKNALERVKDAFFRVDDAHTSAGIGLGLTIADQIVALHQGQMLIESHLHRGTTVTFVLPTQFEQYNI
jgi:PAS domain S-box-containing protein